MLPFLASRHDNRRIDEISPQTRLWGLTFSPTLRNQHVCQGRIEKREKPHAFPSFSFFLPLVALAGLIHWHQIDPIRQTLINLTGVLVTWTLSARLAMRAVGTAPLKVYPIRFAGICHRSVVLSYLTTLVAPCFSVYHLLFIIKEVCGDLNLRSYSIHASTYSTIRKHSLGLHL